LNELVRDACRFVQTFASSIEEHPLLIYLSALPFTPVDTLLFQTFADQSIPCIIGGYNKIWPPLLHILTGHKDHVHDLAFSPDGTRIASASFDNTVRVWDVSSGASLIAPLEGHREFIFAVAFSPDGQQIASGSADSTVRIWDSILHMDALHTLTGHADKVFAVAFSPEGHRVVSGSADLTVRVWDTTTGADIFGALCGHEGQVTTVIFTPDGQWILSGGSDSAVCGWDAITGEMMLVLQGHGGIIRSIAVSSDGKRIASGSDDGTIQLWDPITMQECLVLRIPGVGGVKDVAFIPGDLHIVSMSIPDYKVRLWDAVTGAETSTSAAFYGSESMVMSPTGDRFAFTYSNSIAVWDASFLTDTVPLANTSYGDIRVLASSPEGQRFASISEDECFVRIWDAKSGQESCSPLQGHEDTVESVVFSPDGQLIASGSADTTIIVWHILLEMEVLKLRGHENSVGSVAFSADGTQILSGSSDDTVRLWSLSTAAQILPPLRGHQYIQSVAFHPSGERVISGCLQGTICCWDIPSGAQLFKVKFVEHPNILKSVQFSPNGQLMMASCYAQTGQAPHVVACSITNANETETMMPIAVSPSGWIHDLTTHRLIGKLPSIVSIPVYSSSSSSIAFIPRDRQSSLFIMYFPPSELTSPATSRLLASYYSAILTVNMGVKLTEYNGSPTETC
jgi:WD40 repeat protein